LVDHLKVANSGADGVHASTFAVGSQSLTVSDSTGLAVVLTAPAAITPFPVGGEFSDNDDDSVRLRFDTIESDTTFAAIGGRYFQEADLEILAGDVKFNAGVTYQIAADGALLVGSGDAPVLFEAVGTEEEPVVFEGLGVDAYFRLFELGEMVDIDSRLEHVQIRFGGRPLSVRAAISVRDLLIEKCGGGLVVHDQGLSPDSADLRIREIEARGPIEVTPDALFSIPKNSDFTGNTLDAIFVRNGTLTSSGELGDFGVPYYLGASALGDEPVITIASGSTLTVPAGLQLQIAQERQVIVHGRLNLLGTEAAPISVERPLFVDYISIVVAADADPGTTFEHVNFSGGDVCLTLNRPVNVSDSTFSACTTAGIRANTTTETTPSYTQSAYEALLLGTTFKNETDPLFEAF